MLKRSILPNGDGHKQVAVMEIGWTSDQRPASPYRWHGVTEDQKAEYLVRAFRYAEQRWAPWIAQMSVIYIPDPQWTADSEQYHWSITNPDGTARPAYTALGAVLPILGNQAPAAPPGPAASPAASPATSPTTGS